MPTNRHCIWIWILSKDQPREIELKKYPRNKDQPFIIWRELFICKGLTLFLLDSSAYELQDTIHTLKEENLHLQHRVENLTRALRDLKHLLAEHARVSGGERDSEFQHIWKEWSQQGISAETHETLEQALCLTDLHGAAQPIFISPGFLLLLLLLLSLSSLWFSCCCHD